MVLTDRDYKILREINRWRVVLGRHIKELTDFSGTRACDRRLKVLLNAGYIDRQKILYGIPSLYNLTYKGKLLLGVNPKLDKIKVEMIAHDILVLDSVIYFINQYNISLSDITSDKELHSISGFGIRKHCPDFIFQKNSQTTCVEIELAKKSKERFLANLKSNYTTYDKQIWILSKNETRNHHIIQHSGFPDIEILDSDVVAYFIKNRK